MTEQPKLLLVDDHKIFTESLTLALSDHYDLNKAITVDTALKYLNSLAIDLVITDIELPKKNGVDLIKEIKKNFKDIKIIVLSSHTNQILFKQLITLGIDGFLSKNTSKFDLLSTIKSVLNGEQYFEPELYNKYLSKGKSKQNQKFSPRELDVLKLILEEKTSSQIAIILKISSYTVEGHRKSLLQKTGSTNVVGLVKYSIINNLF